MNPLTPAEREVLSELLGFASDILSNHCCNDFTLPNTPANWALYERVEAWLAGVSVAEWRTSPDAVRPPAGDPLYFADWQLARYFAARVDGDVNGEGE